MRPSRQCLREADDRGDAADRLVGLANAAGGDDNVTVIVIDPDAIVVAQVPVPSMSPMPSSRRRGCRRSAPPDRDRRSGTASPQIHGTIAC